MHTAALARQALGLSLFEMSALLQVSKATLTQYEAGRRRRHGVSFGQNPQSKIINPKSMSFT
jgi:transcriptional regulator with XRE-family HTH domain